MVTLLSELFNALLTVGFWLLAGLLLAVVLFIGWGLYQMVAVQSLHYREDMKCYKRMEEARNTDQTNTLQD